MRPGSWVTSAIVRRRRLGELPRSFESELVAGDRDRAAVRAFEPGEQVEERRLPAPGAADEAGEPPARKLEVKLVENAAVAVAVG